MFFRAGKQLRAFELKPQAAGQKVTKVCSKATRAKTQLAGAWLSSSKEFVTRQAEGQTEQRADMTRARTREPSKVDARAFKLGLRKRQARLDSKVKTR